MFDYVRNNRRVIQVFLALITLPFAFWGVDSYMRNASSGAEVASVGDSKISAQEFQRAFREQQEQLRPALAGKDPALLDTPQMRGAVLESLVSQRLIGLQTEKARLSVSNDQLARYIASAPSLQEDGKFSRERYERLVASQAISKEAFEARVRHDLAMQQAMSAVSDAALPGRAAADRWVAAQLEEREVAEAVLRPETYVSQVKLAPDAVKKYYEANRKRFEIPEQVRAQYVILSLDKLAAESTPSEEDVKRYYETHPERFKTPEERRASHILIAAKKDAPDAEDKAARAKAEDVLAQVKKNPADFARLAKQYSQDPGSAERGGDLDWFGRGMMVPPFEQAVFSLKENEISGIVRSDFGYHVIRLTGVRPERAKPLAEVRSEIAAELQRQNAAKKFGEIAEGFTNTVYEQSDSLEPVAAKYKLDVRTTDWLARNGSAQTPFTNPKLMSALFSDDAIKNKRNTEAVEVAPNTLAAARVLEHKPAALEPLETVSAGIEKQLVREEAARLAAKDGEDKLARLTKGEKVDLPWSAPRLVARAYAANLAPDAVRAVFKADAARLPAFAGIGMAGGYAIYRVSRVVPFVPGAEEPPRAKALREQYARTVAEEEFAAWLDGLRKRYPVEVNRAALESKER